MQHDSQSRVHAASAAGYSCERFDSLTSCGYQLQFESHARAILGTDFPSAIAELEDALASTTIPIEEIVAGGGGEARGTQRLRRALAAKGWRKMNFKVEKRINDVPRESQSHEVDHVREFELEGRIARIALEIEWNNKDPGAAPNSTGQAAQP
jgi:hypothetical protein